MQKHADDAAACFEAPCGLLRYATRRRRMVSNSAGEPFLILFATWPSLSGKLNGG
jgi:hypothetical protein